MISIENPTLLLWQLRQQLRNRLTWTCRYEEGLWKTHLRRREDTEAVTLADMLSRDHERLDGLYVRSLSRMREAGTAAAMSAVKEFLSGLRRHISVENRLLAPAFPSLHGMAEDNPVATMLREHKDILAQAEIIEDLFQQPVPDATDAEIWFGLVAATLSKHEHREEPRLFPPCDILLAQRPDAEVLIRQIRTGLDTSEGALSLEGPQKVP